MSIKLLPETINPKPIIINSVPKIVNDHPTVPTPPPLRLEPTTTQTKMMEKKENKTFCKLYLDLKLIYVDSAA